MKRKSNPPVITAMRRRAEARLRKRPGNHPSESGDPKSAADTQRLFHELQVHQVELEMQNTELRQTRDELESALENYTDLYDFAPVGYFTLAPNGAIELVNLTGASLVGIERSGLVGRSFGLLVAAEFRPAFNSFLQQVFASPNKQSRDFPLLRPGPPTRTVNIEAQRLLHRPECRAVVVDITERKRSEEAQHRIEVLAASNRKLEQEIVRRQVVEEALKKSKQHQNQLLIQSQDMQRQLRGLSHQILSAQEEERKRLSRELHDEIAQILVGINVHLSALIQDAAGNPRGLRKKIARTQRLVEKSVNTVHQFARELRPAVLDDLGLIPALHTFLKNFTARTGIRTRLTAFARVEQLDMARRTMLFRVAQEALTNVARYAQASRVDVSIRQRSNGVGLTIKDDGKSFQVERVLRGRGSKRLGLLGMRERVEMLGGHFEIESRPGLGTTIQVQVPPDKTRRGED
jgi:PAS domain S-box-containing protein